MAPNGKPASFVMQHQRSPLQQVHEQVTQKDPNIRIKNECILFSQSIMSGRWNPANSTLSVEPTSANADGPEPRILSKKRRDLINAEIRELQNLLPLKKSARERLSYLGILALTNTFIRKATFFKKECISCDTAMGCSLVPEFSSSLCGFLLVFNRDGKILYSSENILDYLGNTVVELASQGDSIYDFVDKEDHDQVRAQLDVPPHDDKGEARRLSFFCRMSTSRYMKTQMRSWKNKIVHVTGRYHQPEMSSDWSDTVFFAVCSPVESKPVTDVRHHPSPRATEFKAVHGPDMKFLEVPNTVESLLGYKSEELENTSWYEWIYPEDIEQARQQHLKFVKEDGSTFACVLRMIKKDGSTEWLDMTAEKSQESIGNSFVCNYIVITEEEVPYFRIHHNLLPFPEHYTTAQRQYLAYRSTLLSAALNSDVSSTSTSPLTSPAGIGHSDAHISMSQQMFGDNLDTKSILRRQLIKRKMSSIDSTSPSPYGPEMFTIPPNKLLLRSASEMPYATGAYHAPLQHSTSFPEASYHPHMLYRGFSTEESYLAQLHSPATPTGYLFEGGYTTLAPVRQHSLTFRPSQRSPSQTTEDLSPINGHGHHHNQNNNAQLGSARQESSYYNKSVQEFANQHSTSLNRNLQPKSAYYQQPDSTPSQVSQSQNHSPTQHAPPASRVTAKRSSSVRHSVDGLFRDVSGIIDDQLVEQTHLPLCDTLKMSPDHVAMHQQRSVSLSYKNAQSPVSYHDQSPTQSPNQHYANEDSSLVKYGRNWNQTSCTDNIMQPTNLSTHHQKEGSHTSPKSSFLNIQSNSPVQSITSGSPFQQECGSPTSQSPEFIGNAFPVSSCAHENREAQGHQTGSTEKSYHVQYSISSGHPSTMEQYKAAAAAAFYAAAQQNQVESGQEWMRKYGHMSATEMLYSETEGSPYRV